jgi:hypothetical protein
LYAKLCKQCRVAYCGDMPLYCYKTLLWTLVAKKTSRQVRSASMEMEMEMIVVCRWHATAWWQCG